MTRPLLLGHRGACADKTIPENTFASFDRALADGCDGFEFDVRLTGDGKAVICHDAKIGRVQIGGAKAEQLGALPCIEDVLVRYRHAFLDIELKDPGLEQIVVEQVNNVRPDRVVISSFLPEVLRTVHELDPELPLGLICETKTQLQGWRKLALRYVIPHFKLARPNLIHELHETGRKVLVWTVNRQPDMQKFASLGVAGIISDDTKLLSETFHPRK